MSEIDPKSVPVLSTPPPVKHMEVGEVETVLHLQDEIAKLKSQSKELLEENTRLKMQVHEGLMSGRGGQVTVGHLESLTCTASWCIVGGGRFTRVYRMNHIQARNMNLDQAGSHEYL